MDDNKNKKPDLTADTVPLPEISEDSLDLEAIIREFSDTPEEELPPEEGTEETAAAESPTAEETADTEAAVAAEEPESDTVTGDTIRLDRSVLLKSAYAGAEPIDDEDDAPPSQSEEDPDPQPENSTFSEHWEPEYEEPMGEYVPPQPIIFHPRSRLQELKKKLVAGPEKRYYQLSELGTGKLQALLVISVIVVLLCVGSTVMYQLGMVQENRVKLMLFGQLLAMLISALLGSHQMIEGLGDLIHRRFSLNTLLLFSFVVCCADGVFCLMHQRIPCCAPFSLQVFFCLCNTLHRRRLEISQMDILRRATSLTAIRPAAESPDGSTVLLQDEGQVEDFWDRYNRRGKPDKWISWYAMGVCIAAIAVGITGGILHDVSTGFQVASVTLFAAVPATFFVALSRPGDVLEKRFHKYGVLLCGWDGIEKAGGKVVFPLSHSDLFPNGTVKMNGVKFFGNREPDEVVAYATSLVLASGSGLAPLFEQILESRNCHHLSCTDLQLYEGGVGGKVRSEPVLIGSLSFLKEQGIEVPDNLKVSHAVCVAVDGILSGLFAISYEKTHLVANGLHSLGAYPKLTPTVADGDFLLTPSFLKSRFGVNPKRFVIADGEYRNQITALEPDREASPVAVCTQSNLSSLAFGVTGARSMCKAVRMGLAIHMTGGIIGIGIMLTLTILGALHLLNPLHILLYQLLWCVPGFLATEWTRLI